MRSAGDNVRRAGNFFPHAAIFFSLFFSCKQLFTYNLYLPFTIILVIVCNQCGGGKFAPIFTAAVRRISIFILD